MRIAPHPFEARRLALPDGTTSLAEECHICGCYLGHDLHASGRDIHRIVAGAESTATAAWLQDRGYRSVVMDNNQPGRRPGVGAILFSRPNEAVRMAITGDTLVYERGIDLVSVE